MEEFLKKLSEAIRAFSELSDVWNGLSEEEVQKVSEKYPFHKDFQELLHDMIEWRDSLK